MRFLSRACHLTRKVGRTNPYAAALWGCEIIGIAPSQMKRYSAQAAAATGINQAQRCATTAIHIGFGQHPAVDALCRHVVGFLRYMRRQGYAVAAIPGRIRVAWTCAKDKILALGTDAVKWNLVHGPMGALIAQLSDFGWELPGVDSWRTFSSEEHILNIRVPIGPFVRGLGKRPLSSSGIGPPNTTAVEAWKGDPAPPRSNG